MLRKLYLSLTLVLCLGISQAKAADFEIKFSVLAPEGSTWVKVLQEMSKELEAKSSGKLALKIYAGGVSGDEKDVLRKMRIGQVHAAGFTGVGLGTILPGVRVLELPFLFNTYSQVDAGKGAIQKDLEEQFKAKGFVLLGWSDAGFVNIFSNKAIKSAEDLKGVKMWAWEGDPLAKAMSDALGISPIPLALPDVLTSLQTNLIDAVYGPAAGVVALQWFTKTKFMTKINLANSVGALLISSTEFAKLPADLQTLLKSTSEKYSQILTQKIRQENDVAINTLKNNGIQVIDLPPEELNKLKTLSMGVRTKMAGTLYTPAMLNKVESAIK